MSFEKASPGTMNRAVPYLGYIAALGMKAA